MPFQKTGFGNLDLVRSGPRLTYEDIASVLEIYEGIISKMQSEGFRCYSGREKGGLLSVERTRGNYLEITIKGQSNAGIRTLVEGIDGLDALLESGGFFDTGVYNGFSINPKFQFPRKVETEITLALSKAIKDTSERNIEILKRYSEELASFLDTYGPLVNNPEIGDIFGVYFLGFMINFDDELRDFVQNDVIKLC